MPRQSLFIGILAGAVTLCLLLPGTSAAQQMESATSQHVRLFMPQERQSLGRELIGDIERCYVFMNKATDTSLPRKILVSVNWDQTDSGCDYRDANITVGMNQPAAAADQKAFLFHSTAREIARLGLLELSQGAQREDTEFLFEGMIEILVHEFDHSSRRLEAAWTISRFLDEMHTLGLGSQRSWSSFSSGRRGLRSAAPGITFLTTFRELQGRERPIKLFDALKNKSLTESLSMTFRAPVAELENTWLKRVRDYRIPDEITTAGEEEPQLIQTSLVPATGKPGASLQLRLFVEDRARNLMPDSVFVKDERTGKLLQVKTVSEKGVAFFAAEIPIEANCPSGQYVYQVTAIDEAGNLRRWSGNYSVGSRQ
jgi:hypothetical protein